MWYVEIMICSGFQWWESSKKRESINATDEITCSVFMAVENGDIGMLKSLGIKARSSPLHSFFHTFLDHKTQFIQINFRKRAFKNFF